MSGPGATGAIINVRSPSLAIPHNRFRCQSFFRSLARATMPRAYRSLMLPDRPTMLFHPNFSPLFGLISDASFQFDRTLEIATAYAPLADVEEELVNGDRVRHILWRLDDSAAALRVAKMVEHAPVIIADGHHRYETSLQF